MNPYSRPRYINYSYQLWSIPVELKGSFITWFVILGLHQARPFLRVILMSAISVYFFARQHNYSALFIAGVVLAELFLSHAETSPKPGLDKPTPESESATVFPHLGSNKTFSHLSAKLLSSKSKDVLLFTFALFLCSYPRQGGSTALFWNHLSAFLSLLLSSKPTDPRIIDIFMNSGCILLVYVVSRSLFLQRIFTTPLAKYLGRISFALYCVHVPIICLFGFRSFILLRASSLGEQGGFLVAVLLLAVVVVWAADVFTREVDDPSVRISRWIEKKVTAQ